MVQEGFRSVAEWWIACASRVVLAVAVLVVALHVQSCFAVDGIFGFGGTLSDTSSEIQQFYRFSIVACLDLIYHLLVGHHWPIEQRVVFCCLTEATAVSV